MAIKMKLNDPHLSENLEAIKSLRESGMFSDEEIQKLYNEQIERDSEATKGGA